MLLSAPNSHLTQTKQLHSKFNWFSPHIICSLSESCQIFLEKISEHTAYTTEMSLLSANAQPRLIPGCFPECLGIGELQE